jgi:S-adenosylmethionine decarboxylase
MGDASHRANVEVLLHDGLDLAPEILRRRLVVEGTCDTAIDADAIVRYLNGLSVVCSMDVLLEPVTHRSDRYGWAGWVHWEASGAHFYAWDQPRRFFSVDIYACAPFSAEEVARHRARPLVVVEPVRRDLLRRIEAARAEASRP